MEAEQLASEGKITFTCIVAEDLQLWADPEQLYRVISNLCRNARQALEATPGQGQIDLSAAEAQGHFLDQSARQRSGSARAGKK